MADSPATLALPPIGPAIEVAAPPKPPDSMAPASTPSTTLAAPIPLFPTASAEATENANETAARPKLPNPGPGSGGLY